MYRFVLLGAAGFVAPRHMKAIKESGSQLIAALDPKDSVGVIDSYFPESDFFIEFERFDRHVDKLRRRGKMIDYVSICSPNYLHDAHIRFALRNQAHAICEKPLVLNPWNIDGIEELEKETGKNVYNILQLRLHPSIIELKNKVDKGAKDQKADVDLTYITSRGRWYFISWKGDVHKSGGIATNIGIHFFDMLIWIFGPVQNNVVHLMEADKASGFLELKNARVRWFLSVDESNLPHEQIEEGQRTFRSITVNNEELEFSGGFTDLHNASYQDILNGGGFKSSHARPSIETVFNIRNTPPIGLKGDYHPFVK
ncbi:MAG: Gfo/Idh/MocA family oxidoreductase [Desulfobacteraceae bacterium]|nr:Gfo/Idh/MocA family oxidoreductase [Desulfobacteraceae bacterium]MBC2756899.1 Gfo/Idh/MocA family oxidoreductase [Desulfobacteraceae bacterium]